MIAGAAFVSIAGLATACGGASSPSAGSSGSTETVTTTSGPPAGTGGSAPAAAIGTGGSAPAAPPGTDGSAAAAAAAPCPTRSLQATAGFGQGTAGSAYRAIDFKNISSIPCTLYGYPGVAFAGGTPVRQIGLAATRNSVFPRTLVTLSPGATGNALLRIVDPYVYSASACHRVRANYLQIYPPNQTTPIYLGYTSEICANPIQILSVSVVQRGSGG